MSNQTPTITPRPRQRKAAKAIVENLALDKPRPLGEVLENVGYSANVADMPIRVTESIGFKQALRDMGLTEELITTSLVEDIQKKKQQRIQELKLGAEILGMVKRDVEPPKPQQSTTYNFIFSAETQAEIKVLEDKLKARLTEPRHETSNQTTTTESENV